MCQMPKKKIWTAEKYSATSPRWFWFFVNFLFSCHIYIKPTLPILKIKMFEIILKLLLKSSGQIFLNCVFLVLSRDWSGFWGSHAKKKFTREKWYSFCVSISKLELLCCVWKIIFSFLVFYSRDRGLLRVYARPFHKPPQLRPYICAANFFYRVWILMVLAP